VRRGAPAVAIAALLAVIGAGCGGGGDEAAYREPKGDARETVKIAGGNLYFHPERAQLPAGIDEIELDGEGGVHTLVIDGVDGFKLRVDGDGEHDALKVRLAPGRYTFFCDIPGHRDAGMEGTLTVT